jgi:stalled ribosome alternative rescue factor ArfA
MGDEPQRKGRGGKKRKEKSRHNTWKQSDPVHFQSSCLGKTRKNLVT